jgi:hypothetical protein
MSNKRWGPQTAAGQRVLATIQAEAHEQAAAEATSAPDAAQKCRKKRWDPETKLVTVPVPGIPGVQLPESIAALAGTIDTSSTELQHELIRVRGQFRFLQLDSILFFSPEALKSWLPEHWHGLFRSTSDPGPGAPAASGKLQSCSIRRFTQLIVQEILPMFSGLRAPTQTHTQLSLLA